MDVKELARAGDNRSCVDCGRRPLFGGMRCLRHFQLRVRGRMVLHECERHVASYWCYQACGCRCEGCKYEKARKKAYYEGGKVS